MLNKQSGNMYNFTTHTWNPVKGLCSHKCHYCFMKRFPQKPIRLDERCFKDKLGGDNYIFVGSSTDLFAQDVPKEWIQKVIDHCKLYPTNKYLFQSKNPWRFKEFKFSRNMILGTTLESNIPNMLDKDDSAPDITERIRAMIDIESNAKMITIEPVLDFNPMQFSEILYRIKPFQVNIGADSGGNYLQEPDKFKLELLITYIKSTDIKLVLKNNLRRLL